MRAKRNWVGGIVAAALLASPLVGMVGGGPATAATKQAGRSTAASPPTQPRGSTDEGPARANQSMTVTVVLRPSDAAALAQYANTVSSPGHSNYRRFLSPSAFGQRFGAPSSGVSAVRQWFGSQHLALGATSPNQLSFSATGTVQQIDRAFGTNIHRFGLPGGRQAYANVDSATVPASLGGYVQAIIGLDNIHLWHGTASIPHRGFARSAGSSVAPSATAAIATSGPSACTTASGLASSNGAWTPAQLAQAYQMTSLYSSGILGSSVTIGMFELEPYLASDISAYQTCFGTSTSITNILVSGGAGTGPGSGESALDIEDAIGLAPQANILVYEAPNGSGIYPEYSQMINDDKAQVISTSWGLCEAQAGSSFLDSEATLFQQAAVQGQTILAASGDSGSSGCGSSNGYAVSVDDPASQPYVTAVGGTSLSNVTTTPPAETVWNDTCGNGPCGGGGGISVHWTMPSWQTGPGVLNTNSSGSTCAAATGYYCREVPDVSASADPAHAYIIYLNGGWALEGGTSAAAPLWASLVALVDNGCAAAPVGFINPRLYADGATGTSPVNDITTGNNAINGAAGGLYPSTTNYDMASGLGTPNGARLLGDLCAPMVTSISPANGPSSGGTTVTISGVGFTPGSVVDFGTAAATSVHVTSATSLTAVAPAGTGTQDVTVITGGGTSAPSSADHYTYATPSLTSLSSSTAAEGTQVTVTGAGFGSSQGSSYLTFNDAGIDWGAPADAAALTINSWTPTAITFTVPGASGSQNQWQVTPGSSASVKVSVGGITSNPVALGIVPTSTFSMTVAAGANAPSVQPGGTITLNSATNAFGASQGSGYVTFTDSGIGWGAPPDAAKLTNITWSAGTITFSAPGLTKPWAITPGTTATVAVTTAGGAVSNILQIQVLPVANLSIATSTTSAVPGTQVTLTGTGLGQAGWVTFSDSGIGWGAPSDAAQITINSWTDTAVTFTVPTVQSPWDVTPGTQAQVSITNAAGGMSNTLSFTVAPKSTISLASISPTAAPEGTVVTLTSSGRFGASQGTGYVTFNDAGISWGAPSDAARLVIDSWSDTQITFTVPEPSGSAYQWQITPGTTATVTVTSASYGLSNSQNLGVTSTASIPLVSATSNASTNQVTLTGGGFGASQGAGYVTLVDNGISWGAPTDAATLTIVSWSNGTIVFTLPQASGPNGVWALTPGTTATITVTSTSGAVSNSTTLSV